MSREWLKIKRLEKKMSMVEVAAKAGIAQGYYSDIENGKRGYQVPVKTAMAIAEVLDFSWNRFYEEEGATG